MGTLLPLMNKISHVKCKATDNEFRSSLSVKTAISRRPFSRSRLTKAGTGEVLVEPDKIEIGVVKRCLDCRTSRISVSCQHLVIIPIT